jgi:hypothetical protein
MGRATRGRASLRSRASAPSARTLTNGLRPKSRPACTHATCFRHGACPATAFFLLVQRWGSALAEKFIPCVHTVRDY